MNKTAPAAAAASGFTRVVFFDDFESMDTVDIRNEKMPDKNWYVDTPYKRSPLKGEELEWHTDESFVRIQGKGLRGIASCSSSTEQGFAFSQGYVEARIRIANNDVSNEKRPLVYLVGEQDFRDKKWVDNAMLGVFEAPRTKDKNGEKHPYFCGALHHYHRGWERDRLGRPVVKRATNLVNSTGYHDWFTFIDDEWHTYGVLWEAGRVAWFMDGKEMHSVRFAENQLPRHYYRNNPNPLPPIEEKNLKFAKNQWLGAYSVFDRCSLVLRLCAHEQNPMDVDWVCVWQK